ncbi:MAG: flagellar biosynthesis protein FlhF [Sulfuricellaceae bacterium]|nr:flagellar biosynthesis protein FlhF [Sulfuricellaceae bacterium]
MNVKKFRAANTREALRQVRDSLGADAIILSNRPDGEMIEIMAVANMDVASLATPVLASAPMFNQSSQSRNNAARDLQDAHPLISGRELKAVKRDEISVLQRIRQEAMLDAVEPSIRSPAGQQPQIKAPSPLLKASAAPAVSAAPTDSAVQEMMREIRSLRGMLEGQLAGLAWGELQRGDPLKVEILRHMLAAGFSPVLSRRLLDKLPPNGPFERGLAWVKTALAHNLHIVQSGDDLVERGGVYALVGPTGVGKTTTVAKLAARCRLKHGASKLALLTTDTYRIGAHEQLKIYGKILGVPVYAVKDEADLQFTLADLQNKHLVLIDTVGMSQKDKRLADQVAMLTGQSRSVKRLLLVSANAQSGTLDDVVKSYRGAGMEGCILTKVDEAISIGGALDVIVRHKLPLHYITNGQRVPEDLHLGNANYLVDRAFRLAETPSSFSLREEEYPLIMATSAGEGGFDSGSLRG